MKRFISILLSAILLCSSCFIGSFNAFAKSNDNNIKVSYNEKTRVMTVTGSGAIPKNRFSIGLQDDYMNYIYPDPSSVDFMEAIFDPPIDEATKIVIGEGITEIGAGAFFGTYNHVKTIELPSTLKKIGDYAFYCTSVEAINIPSGCKEIGRGAFLCTNISSISLPSGLEYIGPYAFGNTKLTTLTIPKTVNNICNIAYNCDTLKVINILGDSIYHCITTNCPNLKSVIVYSKNTRHHFHENDREFLKNCPKVTVYCQKNSEILDAGSYNTSEYKDINYKLVKKPSAIKNLKVKSTAASSVSLTWSKSSDCTSYQVQRYIVSQKKWKTLATVTTNSCTIKNLASASNLKFRVRAIQKLDCGSFNGDFSKAIVATTKPSKVSGVKLSKSNKNVTVSWAKADTPSYYQIYIKTGKNGKYKNTAKTTNRSYKLSLKKGKTYYIKVRAVKKSSSGSLVYGAFSDEKSIKL